MATDTPSLTVGGEMNKAANGTSSTNTHETDRANAFVATKSACIDSLAKGTRECKHKGRRDQALSEPMGAASRASPLELPRPGAGWGFCWH